MGSGIRCAKRLSEPRNARLDSWMKHGMVSAIEAGRCEGHNQSNDCGSIKSRTLLPYDINLKSHPIESNSRRLNLRYPKIDSGGRLRVEITSLSCLYFAGTLFIARAFISFYSLPKALAYSTIVILHALVHDFLAGSNRDQCWAMSPAELHSV